MDQPTQADLRPLLASIEEVHSKILQTRGPSDEIKKGWAAELEPLKAPIFFLWERLGYGTVRKTRSVNYWMSSFYTSPVEYMEECIRQLKNEMKVVEYDWELYGRLLQFYGDMIEAME